MMLWTASQLFSLSGLGSFLCRLWKTLAWRSILEVKWHHLCKEPSAWQALKTDHDNPNSTQAHVNVLVNVAGKRTQAHLKEMKLWWLTSPWQHNSPFPPTFTLPSFWVELEALQMLSMSFAPELHLQPQQEFMLECRLDLGSGQA